MWLEKNLASGTLSLTTELAAAAEIMTVEEFEGLTCHTAKFSKTFNSDT